MTANPLRVASRAILIPCHTIAIITTLLRLAHRWNTNRLWWDDFWAFTALFSDLFVWVTYLVADSFIEYTPTGMIFKPAPLELLLFFRFGTLIAYTTTLWAARVSVAVTIVRLLNLGRFRTVAKRMTIVFGIFWLMLVIQKIFMCGIRWSEVPACPIPRANGYLELATDITGDVWLLLAPAYMLWQLKLNPRHHRLILAIFCCGIFTSAACMAHIYFILVYSQVWLGVTGHIELGVSIVVCNLLVLVTYIYRVFWNEQEDDDSDDEASVPGPSTTEPSSASAYRGVTQPTSNYTTMDRPEAVTYSDSSDRSGYPMTFTDLGSSFGNTNEDSRFTGITNVSHLSQQTPSSFGLESSRSMS